MPAEDAMTIDERRKYLKRMWPRYQAADRAGRGALLTEMEAVTSLHRKSLTRLLGGCTLDRRPSTRPRGQTYGPAVSQVIRVVWESLDYVCAERLTPALVPTAQHLARFGELTLTPALIEQLATISVSTVQRRLGSLPRTTPRLPRGGPEQANRVRQAIPMKRLPWSIAEPGAFEVDLVHHGGPSAAGDYVHTLQLVDIATGWSERVAVLGRSYQAMKAGFERVLDRLPFPVRELHPDNGSEFLNAHLVRFFGEAVKGVRLSRSRPYHKNDNRIVEQKNYTLVRMYLGYSRLDTPAQAQAVEDLYDEMWVYYNLFQPVLHLERKEVVDGRLKRTWDTATTPYQRVLATGMLPESERERLANLYRLTNPRALRRLITARLDRLWESAAVPVVPHAVLAAD
jgi:hypothetical protein